MKTHGNWACIYSDKRLEKQERKTKESRIYGVSRSGEGESWSGEVGKLWKIM